MIAYPVNKFTINLIDSKAVGSQNYLKTNRSKTLYTVLDLNMIYGMYCIECIG